MRDIEMHALAPQQLWQQQQSTSSRVRLSWRTPYHLLYNKRTMSDETCRQRVTQRMKPWAMLLAWSPEYQARLRLPLQPLQQRRQ